MLELLREGKSNKLIARDLEMCESTVKVHVRQIMRKLGAANRTQAALNGIGATGQQAARETSATLQPVEHRDDRRRDVRRAQQGLQHVAAR